MKIEEVYPDLEVEDAAFRPIKANEQVFAQAMNQLHCDMANGLVALEGIKCAFDCGFAPVLSFKALSKQQERFEEIKWGSIPGARSNREYPGIIRKGKNLVLDTEARTFEQKKQEMESKLIQDLGGDTSHGFPRNFNEYLRTQRLRLSDGTVVTVTEGRNAARAAEGLRAYPLLFKTVAGEGPRFDALEKLAFLKALVEADAKERGQRAEELALDSAYAEELRGLIQRSDQKALRTHAGRKVEPRESVKPEHVPELKTSSRMSIRNLTVGSEGELILCGRVIVSSAERRWLDAVPSRKGQFKAILHEVLRTHGLVLGTGQEEKDALLGQETVAEHVAQELDRYFKSIGGRNYTMDEEVSDGD